MRAHTYIHTYTERGERHTYTHGGERGRGGGGGEKKKKKKEIGERKKSFNDENHNSQCQNL